MVTDPLPTNRRRLLAAGAGGVAAFVAHALGRPNAARAANGDTVTVGGTFDGTLPTTIENTAATGAAITGFSSGTSGTGLAGWVGSASSGSPIQNAGVYGKGGVGVYGETDAAAGTGVVGFSGAGRAIEGVSNSATESAIRGISRDNSKTGVQGHSGPVTQLQATRAETGVFGYADTSQAASGVHGESGSGRGVTGHATAGFGVEGVSQTNIGVRGAAGGTGTGVFGVSTDGHGVVGDSSTGTAVLARSQGPGYALRTVGRLSIDRTGTAVVPAGQASVSIPYSLGPTANLVIATIQSAGMATLQSAVPNAGAQTITFHLVKKVTGATTIAFLVIE